MKKRKYQELEYFNNVEIPQKDENTKLERIALITISIGLVVCGFLTFYLYQLEQYYN
jgi:hypothetical protein